MRPSVKTAKRHRHLDFFECFSGTNFILLLALILIVSPVFGLTPLREIQEALRPLDDRWFRRADARSSGVRRAWLRRTVDLDDVAVGIEQEELGETGERRQGFWSKIP